MCDDLSYAHYSLSSSSCTTHPSPDPSISCFTADTTVPSLRTLWIMARAASVLPDTIASTLSSLPPGATEPGQKLVINSYAPLSSPLPVALKSQCLNQLYEMRRVHERPPRALPEGFGIVRDEEWYCRTYPDSKNRVRVAQEEVWTVQVGGGEGKGEKAGFMTVLVKDGRAYVSDLEVFEKFRRNGLASALMEKAGGESGKREVWLTVFCSNWTAVNMYFALGYRIERPLWVFEGRIGE